MAAAVLFLALRSSPARAEGALPAQNVGIENVLAEAPSPVEATRGAPATEGSVHESTSPDASASAEERAVDGDRIVRDEAMHEGVAAPADEGSLEAEVASSGIQGRARLHAGSGAVTASFEAADVGLEVRSGHRQPIPYVGLDIARARSPEMPATITEATSAAMLTDDQVRRRSLSPSEPLTSPHLTPPAGLDRRGSLDPEPRGPRASPSAPLGILTGGGGPPTDDLHDHAIAGASWALLALVLVGRLSPGRSDPRVGPPYRVLVPG